MITNHRRHALHAVSDDRNDAVTFFDNYSAFKHGGHEAAEFYATALADLVATTLAEDAAGAHESIVLTSPPFAAIPSASHYLAERLTTKLQTGRASASPLSYIPLRKRAAGGRHDYSRLLPEDRATSQADQARLFMEPRQELRRRHIVIVNDLRVTGYQEHVLHDYLIRRLSPDRVTSFYLGEVSPELACASPEVENRLNLAKLSGSNDYVQFLSAGSWSPTARGVRRLLELPIPLIQQVLGTMALDRIVELAELVEAELLGPARERLGLVDQEASRK